MGFSYLGRLGAVDVLQRAADAAESHGISNSVPYNVFTGQISPTAALALACAAMPHRMKSWDGGLDTVPVPDSFYALFMEVLAFAESFIDNDLDEWAQGKDAADVAKFFRGCARRIEVAVI